MLIALSAPGIVAGVGLLARKRWARIVAIVLGVLHLFEFPFGTAFGAYTLWVLMNVDVQAEPKGNSNRCKTPEHNGTHLDAPIHSASGQPSVDQLTAADLFGPAVVIDVSSKSADDPDYILRVQDILDWEAEHGSIPDGAIVLMSTGWSRKWEDPESYRNRDADGIMHFPGFSEDAGRFLVTERNIRGIGIDNLSIDPGTSRTFPTHGVVNGAGKFQLENVANVHLLPAAGAYLIVAPIKIEGGSGGQVRIFAVVPG